MDRRGQDLDKPSFRQYVRWYDDHFSNYLESEGVADWYKEVTREGLKALGDSPFWKSLQEELPNWDAEFGQRNDQYALLDVGQKPSIRFKPFESTLEKSFRRNVQENSNWPNPPKLAIPPSSAKEEIERFDELAWVGPHNWLTEFPDIFRTRLTTTYFDGVKFLAHEIRGLANETTSIEPFLRYQTSQEGHAGYHAVHIRVNHRLELPDFQTGEIKPTAVSLEIQVITAIQALINRMLHDQYKISRMKSMPDDWQWDSEAPAFAVNYLGSTLHFLEGLIVLARNRRLIAS